MNVVKCETINISDEVWDYLKSNEVWDYMKSNEVCDYK